MNYLTVDFEYQMQRQMDRPDPYHPDHTHRNVLHAQRRYDRAIRRGRWQRIKTWLRGRSWRLWTLDKVRALCQVQVSYSAGLHLVRLGEIWGSESREDAFDRWFYPLQQRTRERWVGIALARRSGQSLPPVELVLVDDGQTPVYFARDGHHRLSVARAYGQVEIEAMVDVWKLRAPAPWSKWQPAWPPTLAPVSN